MLNKITQASLTVKELHQLKWLIGSCLTLFSLWALNGLDFESQSLVQLSAIAVFIALIKPEWIHAIPSATWSRFIAPLILLVTLIDFALGLTNFFPPLMRLIVLLLTYRALAPRNQREDLQMLLLCLLGIVISGALTLSLLFALQILLFTPMAMGFLLIICLLDRGPEIANHPPDWRQFNLLRLIGRVWNVVDLRMCSFGTLLFAFIVILSTGFFILIPRVDLDRAVSFLQMETKTVSGFSDTVRLDSVSEIIEDHSIVLRIDVPTIDSIRSTPYWRVLVLDQYSNGVFRLSSKANKLSRYAKLRELSKWSAEDIPLEFRKGERWTFYFEGGVSKYLPLPSMFHSIRFPKLENLELFSNLHVIGLDAVQQSTFSYQIEDLFWNARTSASDFENKRFQEYSTERKLENEAVRYPLTNLKLALSPEEHNRLSKLNKKLTTRTPNLSVTDYSQRVTTYLRDNFRYSLNPNSPGGEGDPIVNWLENGNSGHCELFAGAFVLLAREAGYPARMVVGFAGGSWNTVEDFFVVRNSDAHAWVEIYDAQTEEWLRVDPTPGTSAIDPEIVLPANFELETGMSAWMDSLRMQWYRRIINFDHDDQTEIANSVMDLADELVKNFSSWVKQLSASLVERVLHLFSQNGIAFAGIAIVFCFGIVYLWRTRFNWLYLLHFGAKKSQALNPIRRQSSQYLRKLNVKVSEPDISESRVKALQLIRVELEALRFGPDVSTHSANSVFKKARKILFSPKSRIDS